MPNPGGQAIAWVQIFDTPDGVLAFLDRARGRAGAAASERYLKFPSERRDDLADEGGPLEAAPVHATCPAASFGHAEEPAAGLAVELVGRALDDRGEPRAETVRKEDYAQDHFAVSEALQAEIARALAGDGRLPAAFGRLGATGAYLGHIDVRPLDNPGRGGPLRDTIRESLAAAEFRATRDGARWRLEGRTEVTSSGVSTGRYEHDVAIDWRGVVEMDGARMTGLWLSGRGTERLRYGFDGHPSNDRTQDEVTYLPAGRATDRRTGVRYGISGVSKRSQR